MRRLARTPGVFAISGEHFGRIRADQTENNFLIFDWLLAFTCLLAGVGIANQMTLSAHVRRAEISLFSALGMTTKQIARMFMFEGLIIGLFGGLFAIILGVPLGRQLSRHSNLYPRLNFDLNYREDFFYLFFLGPPLFLSSRLRYRHHE